MRNAYINYAPGPLLSHVHAFLAPYFFYRFIVPTAQPGFEEDLVFSTLFFLAPQWWQEVKLPVSAGDFSDDDVVRGCMGSKHELATGVWSKAIV